MENGRCRNCGADVFPDMKFCGTCGAPTEYSGVNMASGVFAGTMEPSMELS